jgi:hypothetical protein
MTALRIAIALGFMAVPALAQSIDLPSLTWPTETTAPVTQGCDDPTSLTDAATCGGK